MSLHTAANALRRLSSEGEGPKQIPDSASHTLSGKVLSEEPQEAYPIDAKEGEKARRKHEKDSGIERVVQKRKKIMEYHHDDYGEDLSSLHDKYESVALTFPCDFDTEDELSDQDHNELMRREFGYRLQAFPIDRTSVAKAQSGSNPHSGRDSRAKNPKSSTCPGCKHYRSRDDWEHTREFGECSYPYDKPWIP